MDALLNHTSTFNDIHIETIELAEPFLDVAKRFAHMPGTVLLASGSDLDCANHHILAIKPWLSFIGRNKTFAITIDHVSYTLEQNPFDILKTILNDFGPKNAKAFSTTSQLPVQSGLFGYFAYDLKDYLEELPRTSVDDILLPHICLYCPSITVVHDLKAATTSLCIAKRKTSEGKDTFDDDFSFFKKTLASNPPAESKYKGNSNGFSSNFSKQKYMGAVDQIKEYIASGHIYQANLSQRFHMDFTGDAFSLFKRLFQNNPAPFFAYINTGDHHIISTSPERFLYRQGKRVETRPIKGTRPRGNTPSKDKALGTALLRSKKDDAELSMIVDLLRNDFGKVCQVGSVRVSQHKMLESYENVFHLVSIVEGILSDNKDSVDLIKACFPGGSITGCPKIRSMEIIDELEPTRRHIYTGSIGYISFHDTMDLSIAIRTATVTHQHITFSVGGGIVYDSDPKDEFNETLHKGQTLMKAFKGKGQTNHQTNLVWINGSIESSDHAMIPISDMGFLYGFGFFETIRLNNGNAVHLNAHIERFHKTWTALFPNEPPDISWKDVISQVVSKNKLDTGVAAVKLIATRGNKEKPPHNNALIVTAKPYEHRLIQKNKTGLDITVFPEPRQTPMARYKTLNYLYYFLAGNWARENGFDEAIILNPDGTISETNTANILLIHDETVIKPVSHHVLPGVMQNVICDLLCKWGYVIESRKFRIDDLFNNYQILLTNALMGAVPVLSIDGKATARRTGICEKINREAL